MQKFLEEHITCATCDGELIIASIVTDLQTCCYIIVGECIICGEENITVLALEDFIKLPENGDPS